MKKTLSFLCFLSIVWVLGFSLGGLGNAAQMGGITSSTTSLINYVLKAGDTMTGALNGTSLVLNGTGSMESLFVTGSSTISGSSTAGRFHGDGSTLTGIGGTAGNNSWIGVNTFEAGIWIGTTGISSISATGNFYTSGAIIASTLNGYTFNQALLITSSPTFASLNITTNATIGANVYVNGLATILNMNVTGVATSAAIYDSGLTNTRLVYAGVAGILQDSGNLYFDGTKLTILGNLTVGEIHGVVNLNSAEAAPNTIGTAAQTTFYGVGSNLSGIGGTAGNNTWTGTNTFNNTLTIGSTLCATASSVQTLTAATTIQPAKKYVRITGNGGAVSIIAVPQIVPGIDGQELILEGQSNANTVQLNQGNGLSMISGQSFVLGAGDTIHFIYNSLAGSWESMTRADVSQ